MPAAQVGVGHLPDQLAVRRRLEQAGHVGARKVGGPVEARRGGKVDAHLVPHAGQAVAEGMDRARRVRAA